MSIFSAASIKVRDLLGLTARGQVTKANSLPVCLASDDAGVTLLTTIDASSADTAGYTEALGTQADAAITTNATGSLSGKIRGLVKWAYERMPASLGQANAAGSLSVILSSEDDLIGNVGDLSDAAIVTDTTGSLSGKIRGLVKWAFERMPASLGQKAMSASLPVAIASDQTNLKPRFSWGIVRGNGEIAYDGETADWVAVRNANDVEATDTLDNISRIAPYFHGGNANMTTAVFWVKIPVMASGWEEFMLQLINDMDATVTVDVYAVSQNEPYALNAGTMYAIINGLDSHQIATFIVTNGSTIRCGNGGSTFTNPSNWPIGWLVLKFTPGTDPTSGQMALMVRRSA